MDDVASVCVQKVIRVLSRLFTRVYPKMYWGRIFWTYTRMMFVVARYERSSDLRVAGHVIRSTIDDVLELQDNVTQQITLRSKVTSFVSVYNMFLNF